MRNNKKTIENEMMELRDENDGIEDDGRVIKNGKIRSSRNREKMRDFMKKIERIENIKGNKSFTNGEDYKRKSYPNPHTNPIFDAILRPR